MKFTQHLDPSINLIRHYEPGLVEVNQTKLNKSCIITQKTLQQDWCISSIQELNPEHIQQLLDLKPEVLILGTGDKQVFPPTEIFGFCARQGVSLEVMSNAAACRTYNILTTEQREVVVGLIIEQA
ncbi:Mth938-like domain-containing protein [Thiomicrospira sp. R3]|uniref:Mth938-like domain-containing protein n=1 Tax=Thiomicrospira sp. R3 TaxID=3035472 RepID=UPI00259BED30|nr:Mth938-like domain-containing protein [Thiomicrospira sp. R3]WFE68530.1 Mth938-like domain-containing protein [Thiomicrospira sp. R3]